MAAAETDAAGEYVTEEDVECPNCGEENERGYRYCRQCVSELPGQVSLVDGSLAPRGRCAL
jgi:predicted amidophosphoribosyltransferase